MRILGQRLSDGSVVIFEAPSPALPEGWVRVSTLFSAISPGTEGGKIAAGRMNLLEKARARPEEVGRVVRMARTMGLRDTFEKVRSKLEGAQPLGYSLCGRVIEVGGDAGGLSRGDVVACAGGGWASHADEATVPANLAVRVPEGLSPDRAAFATLGAIALQGVRLAAPEVGDCAIVIGMGIIGCLAGQILRGAGCRVFGMDISDRALQTALAGGAADGGAVPGDGADARAAAFTRGRGADIVLICAGSADSSTVREAGRLARRKGRVVVVGAVGMDLPREDYYRKELSFSVSCSYGPGRYDPSYEELGLDYPFPYVRWTEGRNLEAVLDLMAAGRVDPLPLVTQRIPFEQSPSAYDLIASGSAHFCGMLLEYPDTSPAPVRRVAIPRKGRGRRGGRHSVSLLGGGSFAQAFLLPALESEPTADLALICTRSGLTAADLGARHGFRAAVSGLDDILSDPGSGAVVIASRHDLHGPAVIACLRAGRDVFVEKPLCLTRGELGEIGGILAAAGEGGPILQVGYNRRFSRAAAAVRDHLGPGHGPLTIIYRVCAGRIPRDHWIQDPSQGGGRIIGEACHFIDTMQFLSGSIPVAVRAGSVRLADGGVPLEDNTSVLMRFDDGSAGLLAYLSEGSPRMPKERVEIHGDGLSAVIDNYTSVELHGRSGTRRMRIPGKGYREEIGAFLDSLDTRVPAIPADSLLATSLATFDIVDAVRGAREPAGPGGTE